MELQTRKARGGRRALAAAGKTVLALVLAFTLALPAPALALANDGAGFSASGLNLEQVQPEMQPEGAPVGPEAQPDAAAWDGSADTAWYTNPKSTAYYEVATAADLAGLAAIANGEGKTPGGADIPRDTFSGKVVKLTADITLNATSASGPANGMQQWTPIAMATIKEILDGTEGNMPSMNYENYFDGIFDGQGHVVKNIYIYRDLEAYGGYTGLFGALGSNATVKNLGIDGGFVYGRVAGAIASVSHVGKNAEAPKIVSCYNTATIEGNGSSMRGAGGIFGGQDQYNSEKDIYTGAAYIANCVNQGTVFTETSDAPRGGIAGTGNLQIHSCVNTGTVVAANWRSGAIAGQLVAEGYQNLEHATGIGETYRSSVRHCVALQGCISNGVLYRMLAEIGDNQKSDGVDVTEADDVKFRSQSQLTDTFPGPDDALQYLGHAFCRPTRGVFGGFPTLFWQNKEKEKSINGLADFFVDTVPSQVYTGAPVEPEFNVSYTNDSGAYTELVQGSDYYVTYTNNVAVGKATARITGIGLFTDKYNKQITFDIVGTDISKADVEGLWDRWYYGTAPTADEISANVKVLLGGRALSTSDYSISYKIVVPQGSSLTSVCAATITGKGSLKGAKTVTFKLVRASTSLTKGADAQGSYYELWNKQDLQLVAHKLLVRDSDVENYATGRYKVMQDIDATPASSDGLNLAVDPIGFGNYGTGSDVHARGFAGTIEGQNHTIKIRLVEDEINLNAALADSIGFIGQTGGNVTIKDLTLDGLVEGRTGEATAFVARANDNVTFENCVNKATVRSTTYTTGAAGFVNVSWGNLTFKDCVNEGAISGGEGWAAGFVKLNYDATAYTFENCVNRGAVTTNGNHVGGFIANLDNEGGTVSMTGCANEGDVYSGESGSAGGLIGSCMPNKATITVNIDRCSNSGHIDGAAKSTAFMGGFIGWMQKATCTIENSFNMGTVSAHRGNDNFAYGRPGGFIGYCYSPSSDPDEDDDSDADFGFVLRNVYNAGTIEKYDRDGGALIGSAYNATHPRVVNAYYASDQAGLGATGECKTSGTAMPETLAYMKSVAFPFLLGNAFSAAVGDENGGLPVLRDRQGTPTDDGTYKLDATGIAVQDFTGVFDLPVQVVSDADESKALVKDSDYTVRCAAIDAAPGTTDDGQSYDGTARAVFEGTGAGAAKWSGALVLEFKYRKCPLSASMLSSIPELVVPLASKPYAPAVTVTAAGSALVEGADYTVSFKVVTAASANLKATAKATVTGTGDWFKGSASKDFSIVLGDLSKCTVTAGVDDAIAYNADEGPQVFGNTVRVTTSTGVQLDDGFLKSTPADFDVSLLDGNGAEPANYKDIAPGMISVVLTGMNAWIGTLSKQVKYGDDLATDAQVKGIVEVYAYTGTPVIASDAVSVVRSTTGAPLSSDDYIISVTKDGQAVDLVDVRDSGTYTYTVSATGKAGSSWFGELTGSFDIVEADRLITDASIVGGVEESYLFEGEPITPMPVVMVGGETLDAGYDFEVTYLDANGDEVDAPQAAGTYTVLVTPGESGLYVGSARKSFTLQGVYMTVYLKKGSAAPQAKLQITQDQFEALADSSAEPVSALYGQNSWSLATAATYVTLDDLVKAAGLGSSWKSGSKVSFGAPGAGAVSYTFDEANDLWYYPLAQRNGFDAYLGKKVPIVLAVTHKSGVIGNDLTAADMQATNAAEAFADDSRVPRLVAGVTKASFMAGKYTPGSRLLKRVNSVTITVGETAAVPVKTAKSKQSIKLKAAVQAVKYAKVKKKPQALRGAITVKGAKTTVSYSITKVSKAKQAKKFSINSKGVITVKKGCPKGTYALTVKVSAKATKKYKSASATTTVKVKVK